MKRVKKSIYVTIFSSLLILLSTSSVRSALPEASSPEAVGFDSARLELVDRAIERAIAADRIPGAVLLVARRGLIARVKAYGKRSVEPSAEPMTRDSIFDMASLTKPMATATAILTLIEEGKIRLDDPLKKHLAEFDNHGKGAITIEQLLRHRSGFIADNPVADYADGAEKAWERLAALELKHPIGDRFLYSDINYIVLGKIVEKITGKSLNSYCLEKIFNPLNMNDSGFRRIGFEPDRPIPLERIVPTEREEDIVLRGVVHDPRSRALGGVAGHAGLFSSADDAATLAQTLIKGGVGPNGVRVLAPLTVRLALDTGKTPEGEKRGLGWDVATSFSAQRGSLFGGDGFGHTGFTGTSVWVDLETETIIVLLTSRLHPRSRGEVNSLRGEVATLVAAAIVDAPAREINGGVEHSASSSARTNQAVSVRNNKNLRKYHVQCGIDVLIKRGFADISGKTIGLVTNHTGRAGSGESSIDALFHAPGVKLVSLFSPEHGIRGAVDAEVADSRDQATGLPIHSLYGESRKPTAEALKGLDAVVYDIQDIGARFYTYITTLGYVLESCGENGVSVYVLDRPNPIGGVKVSGPVRDDEFASFIAYHALPVRHGMTVGELARLYVGERKIKVDLHVIACEGWNRGDLYDQTGLMWVNPSPNIRSLTEALLYPGVGLLEACDLAHGRGTEFPFEAIGAPWIDAIDFSRSLNELNLTGFGFTPIRFKPTARKYAGKECGGVRILIKDWDEVDPIDLGIGIATVLQAKYPGKWGADGFLKLTADRATRDAIVAGKTLDQIKKTYQGELEAFKAIREKYLIYR